MVLDFDRNFEEGARVSAFSRLAVAASVAQLAAAPTAYACMHFGKDYEGKITEGAKVAFLFHDGKNAHLVLKTELTAEKGKLPPELAWVVPLPSKPSKYEEVDPAIFDELKALTAPPVEKAKRSKSASKGDVVMSSSLVMEHPTEIVGDYQIQPVEITGDGAAAAAPFNAWLEKNRFNAMPVETQKHYLKRGAVFLAIRAKPKSETMSFKPLHLVYADDDLSFPVKLTHDSRTFDVVLYTLTSEKPKDGALERSFLEAKGGHATLPAALTARHPKLKALLGKAARGVLTRFDGDAMNGPGKKLAELTADPSLSP